jgi:hypothetical protein
VRASWCCSLHFAPNADITHTTQPKDAEAATLLQVLQKHYPETLKEKIMPPDLVAVANAAAEEARKKQEEEEPAR